jgi:hypothetical protein
MIEIHSKRLEEAGQSADRPFRSGNWKARQRKENQIPSITGRSAFREHQTE